MSTKPVIPSIPAASRGELDPRGTWFVTATAQPFANDIVPEFELGKARLLDAADAGAVADVLGRALLDEGEKPLPPPQWGELSDLHLAILRQGERVVLTEHTLGRHPQIAEAARSLGYDGIALPDDMGKALVWGFQNVRNLPNTPKSPDFDRVEMAADESRDAQIRRMAADTVFLADDEYNADIMWMAALEHFRQNPECRFVEVREHGGWYLGFVRDDAQTWATANDSAQIGDAVPQPRGFSGVCVRRDDLFSVQLRMARRDVVRAECDLLAKGRVGEEEPQAVAVVAVHDVIGGRNVLRIVREQVPVGSVAVGDVTEANGSRRIVQAIVNPRSPDELAIDQESTRLLQEKLTGKVSDVTQWVWRDGTPFRSGSVCYPWLGRDVKLAVGEAMDAMEQSAIQRGDLHEAARTGRWDRIAPDRLTREALSLENDAGQTVWEVASAHGTEDRLPAPVRAQAQWDAANRQATRDIGNAALRAIAANGSNLSLTFRR